MRVREYIRKDGTVPFRLWFDRLNYQAAAKVSIALARIEQGNTSNIRWFSGLGEYRIDWGPGYRIYLLRDGDDVIVLLGGGTKNRQQRDIARAKDIIVEYRSRK